MYKPSEGEYSVILANTHTASWVLKYLSKMQDKIDVLLYASDNVVESLEIDAWDTRHIGRKEGVAAIQSSVNSVDESKVSIASIPKSYFKAYNELGSIPIVVIDETSHAVSHKLINTIKREHIVLTHSGNSVYVSVRGEDGEELPGYPTYSETIEEFEGGMANTVMMSSLLFMIINKILAGEMLLVNKFTGDIDNISILSERWTQ